MKDFLVKAVIYAQNAAYKAEEFWNKRSVWQKYALAIALGMVLMAMSKYAFAENAPHSNFGMIGTPAGVVYGCYMEDARDDNYQGRVFTCMVFQLMPPDNLVYTGAVAHCTQEGTHENSDIPKFTCGPYEDMRSIANGI